MPPMDFSRKPAETLSAELNKLIDAALVAETAMQAPRPYLGGSRLGVECLRALGFEWHEARNAAAEGPWPVRFGPRALRRFRMGHLHEDETAAWLRKVGFELHTHRPDGGQFGFAVARDPETGIQRMRGHIDGCLTDGPSIVPYPALWEHKIMKAKKWQELVNVGLAKANPIYWGQVHTYMGYMELGHCLFTALNTDTSDLHFEMVKFDPAVAQRMTDRGLTVLSSRQPEDLPRVTGDPSDFRCKFCDWKERCWAVPAAPSAAPLAKPAWLAGAQKGG